MRGGRTGFDAVQEKIRSSTVVTADCSAATRRSSMVFTTRADRPRYRGAALVSGLVSAWGLRAPIEQAPGHLKWPNSRGLHPAVAVPEHACTKMVRRDRAASARERGRKRSSPARADGHRRHPRAAPGDRSCAPARRARRAGPTARGLRARIARGWRASETPPARAIAPSAATTRSRSGSPRAPRSRRTVALVTRRNFAAAVRATRRCTAGVFPPIARDPLVREMVYPRARRPAHLGQRAHDDQFLVRREEHRGSSRRSTRSRPRRPRRALGVADDDPRIAARGHKVPVGVFGRAK